MNRIPKMTIYAGVLLVTVWEIGCRLLAIPEYLLPTPDRIAVKIASNWQMLLGHSGVTLSEAGLGFLLGAATAVAIAVAISSSERVAAAVYPLLIVTQVVPKIALAPLFLIWFGYGLLPKIIIAGLISFFPIVVNTTLGLTYIDGEIIDLMRSISASRYQVFRMVRAPNAIPYFFSGLKIAILFSVVGALTGEFVGADRGLGYLIIIANTTLDTSLLFAALVFVSLLGIGSFASVSLLHALISKRYGGAFTLEREVVSSV